VLIPNSAGGRLAFAFCGAVMFGVGAVLYRAGTRGAPTAHPAGAAVGQAVTQSADVLSR